MQCPYCQTENREDRERCYVCDRDISMLRLIVNKARHHYNLALEHAERGRYQEAIDELHNALDLDRRFVNAHVVLGTLYAKLKQFDRAREAWEAALALQPELAKAHRYLQNLETVERSLPALRVLGGLTVVLFILVIVLGLALFYATRPDPAAQLLRTAYSHIEGGRWATALRELEATTRTARPGSAVEVAARALAKALRSELNSQVRYVQDLKFQENYPEALKRIAEVESWEPDPETSVALAMIKQDINHYYRQRILDLYGRFVAGEVSYADLAERVQQFLQLYPDIPEKEELRQFLNEARELEVSQRLDALREKFRAERDVEATVNELQQLAAQYPGSETIKKVRPQLVDEILSWMFDRFQSLMDARKYDEARELLSEIQNLAAAFRDIVDVSGPVDLASRVLANTERRERLRQVEQLVRSGKIEEAQNEIFSLVTDEALTTAERAVVFACQDKLDKRVQESRLARLRGQKSSLLQLALSDEETSRALQDALALLDQIPTKDSAARRDVLACAAAAAWKLGREKEAQDFLRELERDKAAASLVTQLRKAFAKKKK